jgi:hypothetical protein
VALIAKRDHATFVLCMWAMISGGEASGPLETVRMVLKVYGRHESVLHLSSSIHAASNPCSLFEVRFASTVCEESFVLCLLQYQLVAAVTDMHKTHSFAL